MTSAKDFLNKPFLVVFAGCYSAVADKNSVFPWSYPIIISVWCVWLRWLWYPVWFPSSRQRSPLYINCQKH